MYRIATIVSACILLLGIVIGFIGFPKIFEHMLKKQINLRRGSETRQIWEKVPFPMYFKVYAFNLTNPEETQMGGKPILHEVGPFVFEEWKDKYDILDNETEDTVSFNMRNTYNFRADLGLSGEEVITMPHPLIQVLAISIKRDKAAMLDLIAQGIEALFEPQSAFVSATFMDLYFHGIDVDCATEHFAASAICLNFHTGAVKGAVKLNETHFKYSLLGASNHSDVGRYKVSRGTRDSHTLGEVLQFEDEDQLSAWNGDECNRLRGTDSTIFPPLMSTAEGLWSYTPDLCRSMGAHFERKVSYDKLPAYRYVMDFGDVQHEPANHCFCRSYPDDCPAKGTMSLSQCNETPMIASLPHFLKGDPKLLDDVEGLQPQEDKHGIRIDFEIISGTMLSVYKRLQFSLDVEPIVQVPVMFKLRALVMPLFWIEESVNLDSTFTNMLNKKIFTMIRANNTFKWLATILGALGTVLGIFMIYQRQRDIRRVTIVDPKATQNKF